MATLDIGAVTRRVAENLRAIRAERRIGLRELSRDLAEHGRPIIPSSLIRAEKGERRIDVDDLVALAVALDVSPNRLLLGPDADDTPMELTSAVTVPARKAWSWATGGSYLREDGERLNVERLLRAYRENRPHETDPTPEELYRHRDEHRDGFDMLTSAMDELLGEGVSSSDVLTWVRSHLMAADWKAEDLKKVRGF